ncbi:HD domain-containing phosphohydrolase [Reinekea marinisedimentorum]|uniref:Putative nucleotidyltransferase with HDIG domain n=1 Tax=Reinekea marinisedimentorum TaxID=230495 RepID=A0A4R3I2G1_9GAMM|nr:HD domain-containing phosphohydrolase [Reinekea marinisedimentorum]TCS39762.1 putative nucleotidyltransferase with HDIG domain [Reinekea marinisedimentorum]
MDTQSRIRINLREVVAAIETTVSLVGMDDTNHGKRVAYIACQLGHALGFSQSDVDFLYDFGMLHDIGVSTEAEHRNLVANFDWGESGLHCEVGYQLLQGFHPLAHLALPVLYHHTAWVELERMNVRPREALMANLVYLADRIDVLSAEHYGDDILIARHQVAELIQLKSGSYFKPEYVEVFKRVAQSESFWLALESRHICRYTWDMNRVTIHSTLTIGQLKQLAMIIAYIVDQKSKFTAQHSIKVAEVARFLAELFGMTETQCDKIEIAGLLHDIGKLHTPDAILNKPGPLDEHERAVMNQHSFETYEILRHISGIEDIAMWAAFHHEGVNGHGYPFHPTELELSTEARIVAVADVFQALVQDRPYRRRMQPQEIRKLLLQKAEAGSLDASIVRLALSNMDHCYNVALGAADASGQYDISFA